MTRSSRSYTITLASVALALALTSVARGQDPNEQRLGAEGGGLVVKTIPLHNLTPRAAAELVAPYIVSAKGGVFDAGGSRAITVREVPSLIAKIEEVLRERDRRIAPATLTLRFQLIAADETPSADPAIEPLASTLRSLFKFRGYRLLSEGMATASAENNFTVTLSDGDARLNLSGSIGYVDLDATAGSVALHVSLARGRRIDGSGTEVQSEVLFGTGVTIPLGQTVVLGSAVSPAGKGQALILVVKPELQGARR
jgi:hypothetical protein